MNKMENFLIASKLHNLTKSKTHTSSAAIETSVTCTIAVDLYIMSVANRLPDIHQHARAHRSLSLVYTHQKIHTISVYVVEAIIYF